MFKIYTFEAQKAGKHILILGAVHGNEIAGTIAQQNIINQIENNMIHLKSGKITFIPIVNEKAHQIDERFVDVNLNRVIKYHQNPANNEEKIANELIKLIEECDIMLDLHSTHCPDDVPFAFIDYPYEKNRELLSLIPVKTALAGWPQIYANQPDITNFCTEEYAHQHNKSGITVECGYHKAEKSIDIATTTILNILSYFDVIEYEKPQKSNPTVVTLSSYVTKKSEGKLTRNFQHLDKIQKDDILAIYESGEIVTAPFDGYIIIPNHKATIGSEWFYLGQ